jgi:acetate kinase
MPVIEPEVLGVPGRCGGTWPLEVEARSKASAPPELRRHDGKHQTLDRQKLGDSIRDGPAALDFLAGVARVPATRAWVCRASGIVSCTAALTPAPVVVTPQVIERAADARAARATPSAVQPRGHRRRLERLPGVPQVACFDTSFHRGHPAVADVVPLRSETASAACSATASTACRTSTVASVLPEVAPEIAGGRSSCAPRERREHVRAEQRA